MTILLKFWKPLVAVILIVGASMWIDSYLQQDNIDAYIKKYETYQEIAKKTTVFADSLKDVVHVMQTIVHTKEVTITKLTTKVKEQTDAKLQLSMQLDSIEHTMDSAKTIYDTLKIKDASIVNLKTQLLHADTVIAQQNLIITERKGQVDTLNLALTHAMVRGDSLQAVLNALPKAPKNPNKIFGISLPSRTTIGIVGFISGVVSGFVLKH